MKYMACLVMLLTAFAACSPDSDASDPGSTTNKTYTLHFNLSPVSGSSASSRAETNTAGTPDSWEGGSKEENMKSWTVVFVKSDGTVAKVVKQPSVAEGNDKKDDVIVTGLEAGTTYSVYSLPIYQMQISVRLRRVLLLLTSIPNHLLSMVTIGILRMVFL